MNIECEVQRYSASIHGLIGRMIRGVKVVNDNGNGNKFRLITLHEKEKAVYSRGPPRFLS
jgi:hypothetical protein